MGLENEMEILYNYCEFGFLFSEDGYVSLQKFLLSCQSFLFWDSVVMDSIFLVCFKVTDENGII